MSERITPDTNEPPSGGSTDFDREDYLDRSFDHVARVRAAREAAQREMESFGDVSEYDITVIHAQPVEEPTVPSQASLAFHSKDEQQEED
ncbi:MAG TPA: hypothetical protein VFU86_02070 [Terriglobales bacterium]|nr:hypothetical protein [Terriglobales bacterium]